MVSACDHGGESFEDRAKAFVRVPRRCPSEIGTEIRAARSHSSAMSRNSPARRCPRDHRRLDPDGVGRRPADSDDDLARS